LKGNTLLSDSEMAQKSRDSISSIGARCATKRENEKVVEDTSHIMSSNPTNAKVFVYTGEGGIDVPRNVVRVRVEPSVTSIPFQAFREHTKLIEVELCEGVVEIGEESFYGCDHSITKIIIPNSLRRICHGAFEGSLRCPIRLHNGIQSIGQWAFAGCIFTNFRVPPLITVIPNAMLKGCISMFSVEMPKNITKIKFCALYNCQCLRNVALPPNAVIGVTIFDEATDLLLLFDSIAEIISELKHRFDGLPIHRLVYYLSYNQGVLQDLIAAINMRSGQRRTLRSILDPTGNQQDCLGMTPLHILTCSSVHDLELYHVIIEKYPTNLITEDGWGATPLLYAFWGGAPAEIIQFLLESYQSLYPDHVFNWTMMVETMGRCDTPKERIENLLHVQQTLFPEQSLNWVYLLNKFARSSSRFHNEVLFQEQMRFLFMRGMSTRVEALAFKLWRVHITNMINTATFAMRRDNSGVYDLIRDKLAYFEDELSQLKEATAILELALWKVRMTENKIIHHEVMYCCQKKVKTEESSIRQQCRITCGADVIIGHVLPFLITKAIN
jgi:hypothetical protein